MISELEKNAMNASDKYSDKYVEITGRVESIDEGGDYFSVYPSNNEWALTGVTCYITTDEQKDDLKKIGRNDIITVRGKITSVGDFLGYNLDVIKIL